MWSSFLLPFQILICSRPTSGSCDQSEVFCMLSEAHMAVNAVGLKVPLLLLDAATSNRAAVKNFIRTGFGATGMRMVHMFDPTHIFKR